MAKTQMRYIVNCDADSYFYYGSNCEVSMEEFEERIKNDTLLEILNKADVDKVDVFFITSQEGEAKSSGDSEVFFHYI